MNRASTILTVLSVALFVMGGLFFVLLHPAEIAKIGPPAEVTALGSGMDLGPGYYSGDPTPTGINLALKMFNPGPPALWALLVVIWIALSVHGLKLVYHRWRYERAALVKQVRPVQNVAAHCDDHAPTELAPLAAALIAGTAWPWVVLHHPVAGLVLAVAMLLAALGAVIRGQRNGRSVRQSLAIGLFAGWATVAAYSALAGFMTTNLGIGSDFSTLTALLLCAGTGATVQWKIGSAASYSVGVIWSLIGIAATTMTMAPAIAIGAILGITAMTVMLVRAIS